MSLSDFSQVVEHFLHIHGLLSLSNKTLIKHERKLTITGPSYKLSFSVVVVSFCPTGIFSDLFAMNYTKIKVQTFSELRMRGTANGRAGILPSPASSHPSLGFLCTQSKRIWSRWASILRLIHACVPLIDGLGHATLSATVSVCRSRTQSFQQNRHLIFQPMYRWSCWYRYKPPRSL